MSAYQRGDSKIWWFKFNWHGKTNREPSEHTDPVVSMQKQATKTTFMTWRNN